MLRACILGGGFGRRLRTRRSMTEIVGESMALARRSARATRVTYTFLGVVLGAVVAWLATVLDLALGERALTMADLVRAQVGQPLLWVIDVAPFLLGFLAYFAGRRQDEIARLNDELERRVGDLTAANEAIAAEMVERQRLEEELYHSQKLEAIGQLAGGIAHDFNNLLTAITGYTDLILTVADTSEQTSSYAREIRGASDRAASLVQQILGFSRKQMVSPRIIDGNGVLRDSRALLDRVIGEHIRLDVIETGKNEPIFIDPVQIEQILMNLVVNARDAMPDGGNVTVRASRVELGPEECEFSIDACPGTYFLLEVIDGGVGMDEGTVKRIFEPFFTTKGRARGTGLGLATTYGILKQNCGFIDVLSHLGFGSTFRVYLPLHEVEVRPEQRAEEVAPRRGTECVLLVEDEDKVRRLASEVLREWGYEVFEAEHAEEALRIWQERRETIDLLLTDVIMPGADGRTLSRRLREERPEIPVLFMSGYDEGMINKHADVDDASRFLAKPFTAHRLASKVRETLDAEPVEMAWGRPN
ncbi:MAG: response regulator [Candidatus Eisenbacteria bacterium]